MSETITSPQKIQFSLIVRLSRLPYDGLKRFGDICISLLGLLLLSPFLACLAWLIRRDSPGPAFYKSPRSGRHGRVFQMLKFRTMYERPESYLGPCVTAQDDPRITRLGRWLRDTKLNELPQLWNVLKGEMSLVGPRPEDPQIVRDWPDEVRFEVLSLRPGVTSPASVVYRDEERLLSSGDVMQSYLNEILPSKLRLDQLYVRHRSLWGDLDVLFWTMLALAPRLQRASPPEVDLFAGPFYRLMRRHLSWLTVDAAIAFGAMAVTGLAWRSFGPLDAGWPRSVGLAVVFALVFSLVGALLGVNRITWSKAAAEDTLDLLPATGVATLIALLLNNLIHTTNSNGGHGFYWSAEPLLPVGLILTAAGLAFIGFVSVRYRARLLTGLAMRWVTWRGNSAAPREKVLIVGSGETGQFAAWMLGNSHYADTLHVVGLVDDDLFKQGARIRGLQVLGQRDDIPALAKRHDVGLIVFAIHNISPGERHKLLKICQGAGKRVVVFPDLQAAMEKALHNRNREHSFADRGLPCELCLERAAPLKVESWLKRVESLAAQGDLAGIQAEIRLLQGEIDA